MRLTPLLRATTVCLVALVAVGGARAVADAAPLRLMPWSYIGLGANGTTAGDTCVIVSGDKCGSGRISARPDGFKYPGGVAVDLDTGDVYVADSGNNRIQVLAANGAFVRTFGWGVNGSKKGEPDATQLEKNVCTAASGDTCTTGFPGQAAGQLSYPGSVAVDGITGDVYVTESDVGDFRVDKYQADGRLDWVIGNKVNSRTGAAICTEREVDAVATTCQAGAEGSSDSTSPYAFKFAQHYGDLLALGGSEDLLYVGDEHRIKEFDDNGRWKREILLASISAEPESTVAALAVDQVGDVYVAYRVISDISGTRMERADTIHEFDTNNDEISEFTIPPKLANATVNIIAMASDSHGRMAVIGVENDATGFRRFGSIYATSTGELISEFPPPTDDDGIAFDEGDDLYVAATDDQEVVAYAPVPVAELLTDLAPCEVTTPEDGYAAFNCAVDGA
jgi:DNA-binding beta-propeller fold protein YncE